MFDINTVTKESSLADKVEALKQYGYKAEICNAGVLVMGTHIKVTGDAFTNKPFKAKVKAANNITANLHRLWFISVSWNLRDRTTGYHYFYCK